MYNCYNKCDAKFEAKLALKAKHSVTGDKIAKQRVKGQAFELSKISIIKFHWEC